MSTLSSPTIPSTTLKFQIDLDTIVRAEYRRTTLIIKNIPNKYISKMLLYDIEENHHGTYDFLYLPIDYKVHRFRCQPSHFCRSSKTYLRHQTLYTRTTSIKASVADNNEPNEVKMQIGVMKKKLKEVMPRPVQEFPWRKAQHTLLDRLPFLVQEALKWSLVAYFIISSLSDVVYTFSINRELIIPVGLFVGCLMADFLKEIFLELFHQFEEIDLKWRRLGLCGLFVLVKFTSTWFSIQSGVFLLHVANGGLMQLLWYWRNFMEDAKNLREMRNPSSLEA